MFDRYDLVRYVGFWLVTALALLALHGGLTIVWGQEAPDTLTVEVVGWGVVGGVGHNCPINAGGKVEAYVGAEITCPVWVIDTDGDPTPGRIIVEVADSTRVQAFVQGDSLLTVRVLRKGNTHIRLFPVPILEIVAYYPDTGEVDTEPPLLVRAVWHEVTLEKLWQETTQFCAYVNGVASPTAKSNEGCPDFGPNPLPIFPVMWMVTDEVAHPLVNMPLVELALMEG